MMTAFEAKEQADKYANIRIELEFEFELIKALIVGECKKGNYQLRYNGFIQEQNKDILIANGYSVEECHDEMANIFTKISWA